jgi:hypothetical protein
MIINELNHKPDLKIKNATVTLNYEEIRDIANGLFYLLEDDETFKPNQSEKDSFAQTKRKFDMLFDLVKYGGVTDFTLSHIVPKPRESEDSE